MMTRKTRSRSFGSPIAAGRKDTFLLHGVTGSGKTAVYIEAVRFALEQGKSAIVLVPEISLTPQMMGEFAVHLEKKVAVFHSALFGRESGLTNGTGCGSRKRRLCWAPDRPCSCPLQNIGLIVIDEEHSESTLRRKTIRPITLRRSPTSGAACRSRSSCQRNAPY